MKQKGGFQKSRELVGDKNGKNACPSANDENVGDGDGYARAAAVGGTTGGWWVCHT